MSERAISQIVTYGGYGVVDIDLKARVYRVEAYEPAGRKVKVLVRAEDGSILSAPNGRLIAVTGPIASDNGWAGGDPFRETTGPDTSTDSHS